MNRLGKTRRLAALIVSVFALPLLTAGTASAAVVNPVTKTFSFIGKPGSKTATLFNIDGLLINARCDSRGSPVVFAFSSASNADLFGRLFDGQGRVHIIKNSSFTKKDAPRGVSLTPSSGDFDSTGIVMFETSTGKVVTVDYALDNSTTLSKLNVCTVYGSLIAT
ncbi:MAG: hypothetical protein JO039_21960 [Solirubrobacterales bacterium]|nr:hypothetical protein [Solirubrobacterales bacterium]